MRSKFIYVLKKTKRHVEMIFLGTMQLVSYYGKHEEEAHKKSCIFVYLKN